METAKSNGEKIKITAKKKAIQAGRVLWKEDMTVKCSMCQTEHVMKYRNIKANLRKHGGVYTCSSCATKQAHKDGKYNIYTDEFKEKLQKNGEQFWEGARDTWKEKLVTPEFRKAMSEYGKRPWINELYRKKMLEANKKLWEDPEFRKKMKQMQSDPVYREKMALIRLTQPKTSTQQDILYSLLQDLQVKFCDDKHPRSMVGYYTFDCRIDPQIGIGLERPLFLEVQGDYWHNLSKVASRDQSKATYLKSYFPEFDLKYLWEHEFNNKDRVVSLLKYWLGLADIQLVSFEFKDVSYRIIEAKEAELFISKYHYAGRIGRSGVNLGFFIGDLLVAVCIFCFPTRRETAVKQGLCYKEVLELTRFAIHPSYQVKNFASWAIAKAIAHIRDNCPKVKRLVSFADTTYNHCGMIYKASNFTLDGEVAPDYWYADDRGYVCHKKTLWNKARQMCMTESEYCEKYNYAKVWGDKKFRYVYDLSR
jgi:hypothetical protein